MCALLLPPCVSCAPAATALSSLLRHNGAAHPPASRARAADGRGATTIVHVDCTRAGGGGGDGSGSSEDPFGSVEVGLRRARQAIAGTSGSGGGGGGGGGGAVEVRLAPGVCFLSKPLAADAFGGGGASEAAPLLLRGAGPASVLSGGAPLEGWAPVADDDGARLANGWPAGAVLAADSAAWPVEIKGLRVGAALLNRSRFPPLHGEGLDTPNWLFAQPWSAPGASSGARHGAWLGVDGAKLRPPPAATADAVASLVGAYAHVLGCVEKDVNSQLTKILAVRHSTPPAAGAASDGPAVQILFRNTFTVAQRFFLENVGWALAPGQFYHDEAVGRLYAWPADAAQRAALLGGGAGGAVAPVLDRLVELSHAAHVALANLSFADTTYYADGYWDGPAKQPSDAAVRLSYCRAVAVEGCSFLSSLGGCAVAVGNASADCSVVGNLVDGVGQGGVVLFGMDGGAPQPAAPGVAAGNNTQPSRILVAHNVMQDLGRVLVHVAGVALRSASGCVVAHNRIARVPRYGLQADSFYTTQNSRDNLFEFNVLADTSRLTTDGAAIEMLGSGNPADCANGSAPWFTNNTVRFNNISRTVGSSSSDGAHVCVHGEGAPPGSCRGLVWGVYLDGGMSGATVHGNVIGATLHGAVFDNAGGNNTVTNNVLVGGAGSSVLMDFGTAGGPANLDPVTGLVPARAVAGSTVARNIFYFGPGMAAAGGVAGAAAAMASQAAWQDEELKVNGSDHNLYFAAGFDAAAAPLFPDSRNLSLWQRGKPRSPLLRCADGAVANLVLSADCSWAWELRADDQRLAPSAATAAAKPFAAGFVVNVDCEGDWAHCSDPTGASTRVCMDQPNGAVPVRNQAWALHGNGSLTQLGSSACLEVCLRGGDVGGCNGKAGSLLQLARCTGADNQRWALGAGGAALRPLGSASAGLCAAPPPAANGSGGLDQNSIVADPLFKDPVRGDFSLSPQSPALGLGFEPIPPIDAPDARCAGSAGARSCLAHAFGA